MKLFDVKSNTYINSSKEINDEDPKFKIGDIDRISKYKNNFRKTLCYKLVWRSFVIKKTKNTIPGHILLVILNVKKFLERFTKKNWKK